MNNLRTIVVFAIVIALSFPDGSSKGCVALSVQNRETVASEISIPTAGIGDNPLEEGTLPIVTFARRILASIEEYFARFRDRFQSIIAALETSVARLSTDKAANDNSRNRRRRWADPLTDLSFDITEVPKLLESLGQSISSSILHPVEFASNVTSNAEHLAENALSSGLSYLWKFITTEGVPWLDSYLVNLKRTVPLPSTIDSFISSFHAVVDVLKLLGYVG